MRDEWKQRDKDLFSKLFYIPAKTLTESHSMAFTIVNPLGGVLKMDISSLVVALPILTQSAGENSAGNPGDLSQVSPVNGN